MTNYGDKMFDMTITQEEVQRVVSLLKDVRVKALKRLDCRIHEGQWWWENGKELLRPLTVEEVIELAKLRHRQFPVLFIVAESYRQFVDFYHLNCLPTSSVRYFPVQDDKGNRMVNGVYQPTVIVLCQMSSLSEAMLERRQAVVYRIEEHRE